MLKGNWYYETDIDYFGEFYKAREIRTDGYANFGPFDTLALAKEHAIGYHMTTIRYARNAIKDIKAFKKPKVNNHLA